ncbi:MAG: fasciclin [Sphingobacteriales bacterium]|nr:fasciclin [Sphingobacteriales bacterium]
MIIIFLFFGNPDSSGCRNSSQLQIKNQNNIKMKKLIILAVALVASAISTQTFAQKTKMVGGAAMYPTKDIVDNVVNSKDHTTLVAAVTAAGLVETLKTAGPFTVFAPTNAAFDKLPAGTVETLVKPESKATLTKILTYHVVAGNHSAVSIAQAIKAGKGKAEFQTVSGGILTASMKGQVLILTDEKGGTSTITISDVFQSNGVIHVVDTVLLPN